MSFQVVWLLPKAEGSGIEVCSADDSAQSVENNFHLHFWVIRIGFHDTMLWRLGSVAFTIFEAINLEFCQLWLHGCQPVCWVHCRICEYWQKCGCCLEKWSGWNPTNPCTCIHNKWNHISQALPLYIHAHNTLGGVCSNYGGWLRSAASSADICCFCTIEIDSNSSPSYSGWKGSCILSGIGSK